MIKTITEDKINSNKEEFLRLLRSVNIEGAYIDDLVNWMESSDFFTAPASTKYHNSVKGGLCDHCLNVYKNIFKVYDLARESNPAINYSKDTLTVVALLHDISKVNFYESYIQNKKIYSEQGTKHDNMGKFDWFAEEAFKVKEDDERVLGGDHGFNSMMLVNRFIPLTYEESVAILNHHCGFDNNFVNRDLSSIVNRYPLVTILHMADWLSTYVDENVIPTKDE